MKCKKIYDTALRLLAESTEPDDNADYEERAPYILASFCTEHQKADNTLRKFTGEKVGTEINELYIPLENEFPLLKDFAVCASLYLAAMLAIDDFPELSDRLYEKYSDSASKIYSPICGIPSATVNKYFAD